MNTLYEILEIKNDASASDIRKGYFSMVRKFPPERFPEKFMEIRNAYETLSNGKTRKAYDSLFSMPGYIRNAFEQAKSLMADGMFREAIPILEEIRDRHPEILTARSTLGSAYFENGNTVKAIGIYEKLAGEVPDNAGYAGTLAHFYLERGWQKKAIDAYNRAIDLDENNISLWIGLSEAHMKNGSRAEAVETLKKALRFENEENRESFGPIYFRLSMSAVEKRDIESLKYYLEKVLDITINDESNRENAGWALLNISKQAVEYGLYDEAKELISTAGKLVPDIEEAVSLRKELENHIEIENELSEFENDNYDDVFKTLVYNKIFPDGDKGKAGILKMLAENEFLLQVDRLKKQINSFKDKYPKIHSRLEQFFTQALNPMLRRKMLNTYEKELYKSRKLIDSILDKAGFDLDEFEDDEDGYYYEPQEPIRRQEPKIGRNDPCPCGSGKKYKKCCGK